MNGHGIFKLEKTVQKTIMTFVSVTSATRHGPVIVIRFFVHTHTSAYAFRVVSQCETFPIPKSKLRNSPARKTMPTRSCQRVDVKATNDWDGEVGWNGEKSKRNYFYDRCRHETREFLYSVRARPVTRVIPLDTFSFRAATYTQMTSWRGLFVCFLFFFFCIPAQNEILG